LIRNDVYNVVSFDIQLSMHEFHSKISAFLKQQAIKFSDLFWYWRTMVFHGTALAEKKKVNNREKTVQYLFCYSVYFAQGVQFAKQ
jgi:hypothetical protein